MNSTTSKTDTLKYAIEKADRIVVIAYTNIAGKRACTECEISKERAVELAKMSNAMDDVGQRHYGLNGRGWVLTRNFIGDTKGPLTLTFGAPRFA